MAKYITCTGCGEHKARATSQFCYACYGRMRRTGSLAYNNRPRFSNRDLVYQSIKALIDQQKIPPTVNEIANHIKQTSGKGISRTSVDSAIDWLVETGKLGRKENTRRSIYLV
mgnify:FL=1